MEKKKKEGKNREKDEGTGGEKKRIRMRKKWVRILKSSNLRVKTSGKSPLYLFVKKSSK